jgi:hypothetical protein
MDSPRIGAKSLKLASEWGNVSGMLELEFRSECSKRALAECHAHALLSMILLRLQPSALMACTRNLPSQMNHDTIL